MTNTVPPTPTPTPTRAVSVAQVLADVLKYDILTVGILEAVENTAGKGLPAWAQAIIGAAIVVLTGVQSIVAQLSTAKAVTVATTPPAVPSA